MDLVDGLANLLGDQESTGEGHAATDHVDTSVVPLSSDVKVLLREPLHDAERMLHEWSLEIDPFVRDEVVDTGLGESEEVRVPLGQVVHDKVEQLRRTFLTVRKTIDHLSRMSTHSSLRVHIQMEDTYVFAPILDLMLRLPVVPRRPSVHVEPMVDIELEEAHRLMVRPSERSPRSVLVRLYRLRCEVRDGIRVRQVGAIDV